MIEKNNFEDPKTAIIRLLKSQGCCQTEQAPKRSSEYERMLRYREQLEMKAVQEKNRLSEIPCAITIAEQIEQLKEVVNGLGRQNRSRMEHLRKIKFKSTQTNVLQINETEQQLQHERLQHEYANLMRTLESTNEHNRRLVERLTRY